jgi:hypothetical protein
VTNRKYPLPPTAGLVVTRLTLLVHTNTPNLINNPNKFRGLLLEDNKEPGDLSRTGFTTANNGRIVIRREGILSRIRKPSLANAISKGYHLQN